MTDFSSQFRNGQSHLDFSVEALVVPRETLGNLFTLSPSHWFIYDFMTVVRTSYTAPGSRADSGVLGILASPRGDSDGAKMGCFSQTSFCE